MAQLQQLTGDGLSQQQHQATAGMQRPQGLLQLYRLQPASSNSGSGNSLAFTVVVAMSLVKSLFRVVETVVLMVEVPGVDGTTVTWYGQDPLIGKLFPPGMVQFAVVVVMMQFTNTIKQPQWQAPSSRSRQQHAPAAAANSSSK